MKNSILILFALTVSFVAAREPIGSNRYEALTGVRLLKENGRNLDRGDLITSDGQHPSKFLVDNFHYIPQGAKVLKVGLENGLNAIFLARKGYKVVGIDSDTENVKIALRRAKEFGVRIDAVQENFSKHYLAEDSFDAILCFADYSDADYKKMLRAVKKGGILIFSKEMETKSRAGRLMRKYRGLKVLKYEAPVRFNDFNGSIILVR